MNKLFFCAVFIFLNCYCVLGQTKDSLTLQKIKLNNGVELHYVIKGTGDPVLFVHGSLSDYSYWTREVEKFSKYYKAISYSRRYNFPNHNVPEDHYSAVTDAKDLAAFITKLKLKKVNIVGHSYGALTALFLAKAHSELINSVILCEPPAISLLNYLQGDKADTGKSVFREMQSSMVAPMKQAFASGNEEEGVKIFINYILRDSMSWQNMSPEARKETMKNVAEWDVILKRGEFFPSITPLQIRNIKAPVLLLSGSRTYLFLTLINAELHKLLPNNKQIVLEGASHRMWYEKPEDCRGAVMSFLKSIKK
jgi:pimeloyl-ACP methyl ester carboxylesterase